MLTCWILWIPKSILAPCAHVIPKILVNGCSFSSTSNCLFQAWECWAAVPCSLTFCTWHFTQDEWNAGILRHCKWNPKAFCQSKPNLLRFAHFHGLSNFKGTMYDHAGKYVVCTYIQNYKDPIITMNHSMLTSRFNLWCACLGRRSILRLVGTFGTAGQQ